MLPVPTVEASACGDSLKRGHRAIAARAVPAKHLDEDRPESAELDAPRENRQHDPSADEEDDHRRPPHVSIQPRCSTVLADRSCSGHPRVGLRQTIVY